MKSELFYGKNIVVQGITGAQGSLHTKAMLESGAHIIGGISPKKAGQTVHGVPVFASLKDVPQQIDSSVIFVPAPFAKAAILEAIEATVPLIVVVTEGIPQHDMLEVKRLLKNSRSQLLGPNSPGVIVPGVHKIGIIPASMSLPGSVGIVSRSGTLTYETMAGLTARGVGQKYVIGVGGDPIKGTGFVECLKLFNDDPEVSVVAMIGEIGGTEELTAAELIATELSKPVVCYIAGHYAPEGVQLGHAGAILDHQGESAAAKTVALANSGAIATYSIDSLVEEVAKLAEK